MDVKAEIKKVVLKVSDKEISLTVEEAKKLKELLNGLFGKEIVKEVIIEEEHHHDHYPWRWNYPDIIWTSGNSGDKQLVEYKQKYQTLCCSL